jgi:diacylglycerol kinase (ATP)
VLPRFRPLRISIDGQAEEVMFAVFANSSQYGSGIRIAPDASITDGRLDACIVHRTSRLQLLKTLPRAYTGTHIRSRFVETRRAEFFRVDADPPLDVYADGERLTQTPVAFRIASDKLRVVAPSR